MSWVTIAVGVIGAGASAYGAKKQGDAAKKAAAATQVRPIGIESPFGVTSFQNGQGQAYAAPNPFMNLFGNLGISSLANAGAANSMPYNGANPALVTELQAAAEASQPGSNEFADVLAKLRNVAAPEEQRQNVALDDQLFARGQLGTTGGAERFRALKEAQLAADNQRQLAAQGIATDNANNRFQRALTTVNQGMSNQQQQFNIGSSANANQQNMWQALLQQMGVGVSAGGGQAPGAAMFAAQQAGNVPLAIAQTASNPAFANILSSLFNRQSGTPAPVGGTGAGGGVVPSSSGAMYA